MIFSVMEKQNEEINKISNDFLHLENQIKEIQK
jgi:hypothetical protein